MACALHASPALKGLGRKILALERDNAAVAARQTIDKHFKRHGIKPNIVIETSSMTTLIELVRSGSLVTILPDAVAFERDDLRFRPLCPAIDERRVVLLQREGGYRSAAVRAFIATLELFAEELNAASLT